MRVQILALAAFSIAGLAHAGSIDKVKMGGPSTSVERITCEDCSSEAVKKIAPKIVLAPGTQKIELREVNGVMKVYRTEAWLGGSPIVFVSKASDYMIDNQVAKAPVVDPVTVPVEKVATKPAEEQPMVQPAKLDANMIDENSKTSAVTADMGAAIKVEPKKAAFDPSQLQLRLD